MTDDPWVDFKPTAPVADDPWVDFKPGVAEPGAVTPGSVAEVHGMADSAKGLGMGLYHGAAGLAGLPGDISSGIDKAIAWPILKGAEKLGFLPKKPGTNETYTTEDMLKSAEEVTAKQKALDAKSGWHMPAELSLPFAGSGDIEKAVDKATGISRFEPQTEMGQTTERLASFLPASMLGPGGVAGNALRYGVVPAATSEVAGRGAKAAFGPDAEKYGRVVGAVGGAGVGGIGSTAPPTRLLADATRGVAPADIAAARAIQERAAQQGINLTGAEAIAQATGGRGNLSNVARVLEGAAPSAPIMREFYAQRPGQVETAARNTFDTIAPPTAQPSMLGAQGQTAGQGVLDTVRGTINNAAEPFYQRSANHTIPPHEFAPIERDPAFQYSLERLRRHPVLGPQYANMPDNSIGVIDAVTKDMRGQGTALRNAANPGFQPQASGMLGSGSASARDIARDPFRGGHSDYDAALTVESEGRRRFLEPREVGPVGKIAGTSDAAAQGKILYPSNPPPGSQNETAQAITDLEQQHAGLPAQLTRQHLEHGFNEANQANMPGENQWGGAKFAASMMGNPQQARNMRAGLGALPGQPTIDPLVEALQATGTRQPIGSQTSFNTQLLQGPLAKGGPMANAASLATSPSKLFGVARDWYTQHRMGANTEALAHALTSPNFFDQIEAARRLGPLDRYRALLAQGLASRNAFTPPSAPLMLQPPGEPNQPR